MHVRVETNRHIHLHGHGLLFHTREASAHEAVIPRVLLRDQEIAADLVAQQQLGLFAHTRGAEAGRHVGAQVFVLRTPFVALGRQGPGGEGDGAGGEGDGHGDGFLVPSGVGGHEARVVGYVCGGHVGGFVARYRVNDT